MVNGIASDDIILVKNTPEFGFYSIVKVIGEYYFESESEIGKFENDYRHYISVNTLVEINKENVAISGDLSNAVGRSQSPISLSLKRAEEIRQVLNEAQRQTISQRQKAASFYDRIGKHSNSILEVVEKAIRTLAPWEFEKLVFDLIKSMDFESATWTAGAGEHGADIVMSASIPFFDDLKVVVQVKHRQGTDNGIDSVEQLKAAFQYYNAVAGMLVDSAETLGPELTSELEKAT